MNEKAKKSMMRVQIVPRKEQLQESIIFTCMISQFFFGHCPWATKFIAVPKKIMVCVITSQGVQKISKNNYSTALGGYLKRTTTISSKEAQR